MTSLRIIHKHPCSECPWRKNSPKGWLGGNTVEDYAAPVQQGIPVPCHLNAHKGYCAGAAITMKNSCTVPRDPAVAAEMDKVERSDAVFMFVGHFREHHTNGILSSTQGAKARRRKNA